MIPKNLEGLSAAKPALPQADWKGFSEPGSPVTAPRPAGIQTLAVAANFTAEPLEDTLHFWIQELALPLDLRFAPYNQLFQQLLAPSSLLAANARGLNILLLRFEDLAPAADDKEPGAAPADCAAIEQRAAELLPALKDALERTTIPWLACVCPASKTALADSRLAALFTRLERLFAVELAAFHSLHLVLPSELLTLYPVPDYDDPQANRLGHVPYTPPFYTGLATLIARKAYVFQHPPKKVIALDCDQTLWSGVCGEDGPTGIQLDAARLALQQFMREQRDAGMLLCLCSKNNEADVAEAFRCRPEMPLRPDDFAAQRVNWRPKSENLRSLAQELNLGLDSFILLDDNPIECAEVEANSPEVLALQLPENLAQWPQFLRHVWAFDRPKLTAEDRQRAAMYQQNRLRQQFAAAAASFADFLAGLQLQVQLAPARPGQLERVFQLTQRTNQFNCVPQPRSEAWLRDLHRNHPDQLLAVTVSDRFGDYGLVGVMIYEPAGEALNALAFLLSCRVLGKTVEHRMLAHLGQIAQELGLPWVNIPFRPTGRNQPALDFLARVGAGFRQNTSDGCVFRFPAATAAAITFEPEDQPMPAPSAEPASPGLSSASATPPARYSWIARHAGDPEQLLKFIEGRVPARPSASASAQLPPVTPTQRRLCALWQEILRLDRVGIRDDFFELGGTSQLAVRFCSRLEKLIGRKLPLAALFKAPTIEGLAEVLERK